MYEIENMPNLQQLAFRAIPRETYRAVMNDPSMEDKKQVLEYTKKYVMNYRKFTDWSKTVKMPRQYIQKMLILLNHYTKRDFFIAYNIIKKKNRDYLLKNVGDYWDEIVQTLDDKILFNQQISEHETIALWDQLKWPNILQRTFYFLCYRRLQRISYVRKDDVYYDDNYDQYMNGELFDAIMKIPDNDLLPLVIYTMIYKFNKQFDNPVSAPRSPVITLSSRSSTSGRSSRSSNSGRSSRSSTSDRSGNSGIFNYN
jgi:hypothetical protein